MVSIKFYYVEFITSACGWYGKVFADKEKGPRK